MLNSAMAGAFHIVSNNFLTLISKDIYPVLLCQPDNLFDWTPWAAVRKHGFTCLAVCDHSAVIGRDIAAEP